MHTTRNYIGCMSLDRKQYYKETTHTGVSLDVCLTRTKRACEQHLKHRHVLHYVPLEIKVHISPWSLTRPCNKGHDHVTIKTDNYEQYWPNSYVQPQTLVKIHKTFFQP